jgi:hypothetical protein
MEFRNLGWTELIAVTGGEIKFEMASTLNLRFLIYSCLALLITFNISGTIDWFLQACSDNSLYTKAVKEI